MKVFKRMDTLTLVALKWSAGPQGSFLSCFQEKTFRNEMGTICRRSGCHVVFNGITDCASEALLYNNDADTDRQMPNADGYEPLARRAQIKHTHRASWQRPAVNLIDWRPLMNNLRMLKLMNDWKERKMEIKKDRLQTDHRNLSRDTTIILVWSLAHITD